MNKNIYKHLVFLVFFLYLGAGVGAFATDKIAPDENHADETFTDELVIVGISFDGLKRTKESAVEQIIRPIAVGTLYDAETDNFIIQKLREAGIFNPDIIVETRIVNAEVYIEIFLRDRWTLIPVPIVSLANDGAWRAGVLTIDSNFLGFYKTLGLGFFFGSEGWTVLSFFGDQSLLGSELELTAGFTAGLDEPEDQDVNGDTLRTYQTDKLSFGFGLEYPLTDKFSIGGLWDYDQSRLRSDSSLATGVPNLYSTGIGATFEYSDLYYDIPYTRGFSAKNSFIWNWGFNGSDNYPVLDGKISWSFNPFFNHLVNVSILGGWGTIPTQKQFRLGGVTGSLILPMKKIAADEFVSSSVAYNIPLWSFKGGTVSAKTFYEAGYYSSDIVEMTLFHGPGLGLELFIKNLALPAIGVNAGWNLETGRFQVSGGVGMGGGAN